MLHQQIAQESGAGFRIAQDFCSASILSISDAAVDSYDWMTRTGRWPLGRCVEQRGKSDSEKAPSSQELFRDGGSEACWQAILQSPDCQREPLPAERFSQEYVEMRNTYSSLGSAARADEEEFLTETWAPYAIHAVTVHLHSVPKAETGFGQVMVTIPVAQGLMPFVEDLNLVINAIAWRAYSLFRDTPRGATLLARGSLEQDVGHHKRSEMELGGYRYVTQACASERPAFLVTFRPSSSEGKPHPVELLHAYNAMGLSKQHAVQQCILARLQDYALAGCFVVAAQELLRIGPCLVRAVPQDPEACGTMLAQWESDVESLHFSHPSSDVNEICLLAELDAAAAPISDAIAATHFSEMMPFVQLMGYPAEDLELACRAAEDLEHAGLNASCWGGPRRWACSCYFFWSRPKGSGG